MTQNIESYPLHWPAGKERTTRPERARFQTSISRARDAIFYEIRLMGGKNIILSTNQKLRLDGLPASRKDVKGLLWNGRRHS